MENSNDAKVFVDRKSSSWTKSGKRQLIYCPNCNGPLSDCRIYIGIKYVVGSKDNPSQIWNADLYRCGKCQEFVVTDFADRYLNRTDFTSERVDRIEMTDSERREYLQRCIDYGGTVLFDEEGGAEIEVFSDSNKSSACNP